MDVEKLKADYREAKAAVDKERAALRAAIKVSDDYQDWFCCGAGTQNTLGAFVQKGDKPSATEADRAELNRLDAGWRRLNDNIYYKLEPLRNAAAVALADFICQ